MSTSGSCCSSPNCASAQTSARATTSETKFAVEGMTCQGCARNVTQAALSVAGVARANVDLLTNSLEITWKPQAARNPSEVIAAIREAGYSAKPMQEGIPKPAPTWSPTAGWRFNLLVGGVATVLMMIAEWGLGLGMDRRYHWVAFALATPVQFFCGARFYLGAWNQLKRGASNMDTLVALGSSTAYLYSAFLLFTHAHGHLYFMDAAAIITLISVGHFLEAKMSARAARTLRGLLELTPPTARKMINGQVEMVPVAELRPGDQIQLQPGDRVPTDGRVLTGSSAINESMLTGESRPVEKEAGSKVYGGSVNEDGQLLVEVTATGEATALARIISIVQEAQQSKASIQRLGDQVSNIFVPIVIVVAVLTGLWWGLAPESARAIAELLRPFLWTPHNVEGGIGSAIFHVCAVLIVACPCAMGIATPIAMMAGANAAAERGILVRDGSALEKSGAITAVLFDKTGTLTAGKMAVAAEQVLDQAATILAASMAARSSHPLSRAVASARSERIDLTSWKEIRGSGVEAADGNGQTLRLGSPRWLEGNGVDLSPQNSFVQSWTSKGATVIALARGADLLGLFALQDQIKPRAREVIAELNASDLKPYMVTGDSALAARAIAAEIGIPEDHVFAEQLPEGKIAVIKQLQARGERVCFVGDGINDAPALEQADLGIAVSSASDVAREAADIILLNSEIEAVPGAIRIARATLRTIKQNLFWAFFYNVAAIPLAILGFFTPILSAAAMGLSDLVVILNALRLRYRSKR